MRLHKATRYKKLSPKWVKYRDLYEGDHDTLVNDAKYLWPHPIELMPTAEAQKLYTNRKTRTQYLKLVEMVVSILCSTLFKEPPTLDDEAKKLLETTGGDDDIDGEGTTFKTFIVEGIAPSYIVYGDVAVLAESFNTGATSLAEERERGQRPYLKLLLPLSLVDWDKEASNPARLGKLNFARYEFYKELPRASEQDEIKKFLCSNSIRRDASGQISIQKYVTELDNEGKPKNMQDGEIDWTPTELVLLDKALTEIPISLIQAETWIDGVCAEALRHFNTRSNLDSINHFTGYPSTFMFGVDPSKADEYKLISEYTITFVKDTEARVERLSSGDSAALERAEANAINTVFKVGLDQVRSLPTDSKAVQGSETISEENRNLYTMLMSTIDRLENLSQTALDNYALLNGEKNFQGKVIFNREIKEEDINVLIRVFNSFRDILMPIEGMSQAMAKKIIPKLKFDEETTRELLDNAESLEIEPEQTQEEQDPIAKELNA